MASTMRCLRAYRRSWGFNPLRCSSLISADAASVRNEEPNSLYPPIKPKYPPGKWGGMEPSYAWLWHKQEEESLAIPDVQSRIEALCTKEMNQYLLRVKDYQPRTLDFKKYATKTHVLPGFPDIYRTSLDSSLLDDITSKLSSLICDLIVLETDQKLRRGFLKKFKSYDNRHHQEMAHLLLRSIIVHLTSQLSAKYPHLLMMQFDEKVSMSAFWDLHGISRTRTRMKHPERFEFETVNDARVTSSTTADFVLRADKPLPEFVCRDAATSVGEVPDLKYSPIVYGQKLDVKGKRCVEAGHVWGDPCEFGSLAVLNTVWSHDLAERYGPSHAQEARLGQGIGTSFIWLAAQAHNQGFNTLIDLTYPLTTQTVLTDGQHWQFMAYQLNTMQLWKDKEANNLVNLCWVSDENKLFESVEGEKVLGFNPEVLRQLIAFLALAPADRPYDLRPTLPFSATNPRGREIFVPVKEEKVVIEEEEKYVIE